MKIFLDTNVLVSAFISRGLCADLMELILAEHELTTGEVNLIELQRVLRDKIHIPESRVQRTIEFLSDFNIQEKPAKASVIEIRDPDDQWVLQSAIDAKADLLITGDKDLLILSDQIEKIRIISPREYWEMQE